jgi:hypothetical protein
MTCKQALALMQAFGDGELDAVSRRRVLGHVAVCDACRREYQERRRLVRDVAAAIRADGNAPGSIAAAVSNSIAARPLRSRTMLSRARRIIAMRSFKIAFSAAALVVAAFIAGWSLVGPDIALAKAIDDALRGVKAAHFTAVEGNREVEVWATQDAERVSTSEGWMIATGGRAYLFDPRAKRVTISKGAIAHLQMVRGLNVLLLSQRLRGKALGKPTVTKKTVTLPSGEKMMRISGTARARHWGVVCTFKGTMLVNPATNLIMRGEAQEIIPNTRAAQRLVRQGKLRTMHVRVNTIDYNPILSKGLFDTSTPPGWKVSYKRS